MRFTRRELIAAQRDQRGVPGRTRAASSWCSRVASSSSYGREALTICVVARKLQLYGMDSRHMRAVKQSAEREAGLVEQAILPFLRRHSDASEAATEVTQLIIHAHAAMMHQLLER